MKRLVSLHLEYLFNKVNIFVFSICTFIFFVAISSNLVDVYTTTSYNNKSKIYLENSLILFEVFSVILSCFIFSFNCLKEKDEYRYLCVKNEDEKKLFLRKKIVASFLFLFLFTLINLLGFLLIGYLGIKDFNINWSFCFKIVSLFLHLIYYGLLTLFLIKLFDNLFIVMIPIIGKFISLYLVESKNTLSKYIFILFPSVNKSNVLLVIIQSMIFFIMIIYIEINKEY